MVYRKKNYRIANVGVRLVFGTIANVMIKKEYAVRLVAVSVRLYFFIHSVPASVHSHF